MERMVLAVRGLLTRAAAITFAVGIGLALAAATNSARADESCPDNRCLTMVVGNVSIGACAHAPGSHRICVELDWECDSTECAPGFPGHE
jgi:hypothetical protein